MDDRIVRARIEAVRGRAVVRGDPVGGWEARTADHLGPESYRYLDDWSPVTIGRTWPAGKTLFLRTRAELPAAGPGQTVFLSFDHRLLEGLLSIDGKPFAGIDRQHSRVPMSATGSHELLAEFMCVPDSYCSPEARREQALLREVRLDTVQEEMEAFAWDVQFAWEAARDVKDARRCSLINAAVEKALLAVDLTAPIDELRRTLRDARELLRGLVSSIGSDPEEGRVFLTGNSHIDTAWLWPLRETVRKCGRTFSTACRLLERHPDYRFNCSQPQQYAYVKRYYPDLYEEIRRWVAAGRWECTGGMWVESDCNVPSGESLVRQFLYGIEFFQREFGKRPRACWLPDVFGYPASLPGILAGCGIASFYTNKLHWQARNPFPLHLFRWEGIDGNSVTAHIPRLRDYYTGSPNPEQLRIAWEGFNEKAVYQEMMLPFGYGDGGGGPTQDMLEFADRARGFPGLPSCRQGFVEEYFDEVARQAPALPSWEGELYLETHRGTYTTQSETKKANRKNELALRDAEILSALAEIEGAGAAPAPAQAAAPAGASVWESLRSAWADLLLLQFHDILPGSSIGMVYAEAKETHDGIAATARQARDAALGRLSALPALSPQRTGTGKPKASARQAFVTLFNTLSWERGDPVEVEIPDLGDSIEAVMSDGGVAPAQVVGRSGGSARIVFVPKGLPPVGCAGIVIRAASAAAPARISMKGSVIESPLYRIRLGGDGAIEQLFDKRNGREVVPEGASANALRLYQDGPEGEAAWNVHLTYECREYPWDLGTTARVVEQGPVRLVVRVSRRYRQSTVEQDMVVWADCARIDFVTRMDWSERQILVKACFPVAVKSDRAAYEIQFGAVHRATHRNTSWEQEKFEVCAHRWMDLSEPGYGVSILNDSRYGCDTHGRVMRLSLLRGPEWPDPEADKGRHELLYSLLPHAGNWTEAGTVRRAWELNSPAIALPAEGAVPEASFLSVSGPGIMEALKRAEDGKGWILRVYEPHGGRGTVTVTTHRKLAAVESCNHVEEGAEPCPFQGNGFSFPIMPFQVRTFRIVF